MCVGGLACCIPGSLAVSRCMHVCACVCAHVCKFIVCLCVRVPLCVCVAARPRDSGHGDPPSAPGPALGREWVQAEAELAGREPQGLSPPSAVLSLPSPAPPCPLWHPGALTYSAVGCWCELPDLSLYSETPHPGGRGRLSRQLHDGGGGPRGPTRGFGGLGWHHSVPHLSCPRCCQGFAFQPIAARRPGRGGSCFWRPLCLFDEQCSSRSCSWGPAVSPLGPKAGSPTPKPPGWEQVAVCVLQPLLQQAGRPGSSGPGLGTPGGQWAGVAARGRLGAQGGSSSGLLALLRYGSGGLGPLPASPHV